MSLDRKHRFVRNATRKLSCVSCNKSEDHEIHQGPFPGPGNLGIGRPNWTIFEANPNFPSGGHPPGDSEEKEP